MIHPTTVGPFSEALPSEKLDSHLKAALAEDQRTEDVLRQRTRLPDEFLNARRYRDVHFGPAEAAEHGVVDAIRDFSLPKGNEIIQI